jgi:hypothetical protein
MKHTLQLALTAQKDMREVVELPKTLREHMLADVSDHQRAS